MDKKSSGCFNNILCRNSVCVASYKVVFLSGKALQISTYVPSLSVERCGVNLIEETTNTKHTHQQSEAL